MNRILFVLVIISLPFFSFAQNGSVSFGAFPPGSSNSAGTSMGMSFDNSAEKPHSDCKGAMEMSSFKAAKENVAKANYEDAKLSAAKSILATNCFSTEQVIQVCKLFGFEQSKLDFAKFAYSKTTDPANYPKVASVFAYEASKKNLDNFIKKGGK